MGTLILVLVLWRPQTDQSAAWREARAAMVREIEARGVSDSRVLEALRTVPRHEFVPTSVLPKAYDDQPLPIGAGQTISQPYIVALMTELLQPRKEDRVLEVGSGSGYQAAVLAGLVKQVYTMEIDPGLAASARQRLRRLQYKNVEVRHGDGYAGWPEQAPFDKIIVTAAPVDIPARLVAQLKPGGRMVIPAGPSSRQELMVVEKDQRGKTKTHSVLPVRFVPMVKPQEPPPPPPPSPPLSLDIARGEVQRAEARLEKTREAFAAGAVVRKDVEAAERAVADAQERLDRLAAGTVRLTPAIAAEEVHRAEERLGRLQGDLEKVSALGENGMAARRDVEQAQEAVREATGFLELARLREQELNHEWELARRVQEWQARGGRFDDRILESLEEGYLRRFGQPLPISANGLTLTHAIMNFDHSGRTDVALPPDSTEGRWLVDQLTLRDIPFLVYRGVVPGKATGAHIHLGLPSPRLREMK